MGTILGFIMGFGAAFCFVREQQFPGYCEKRLQEVINFNKKLIKTIKENIKDGNNN